MTDETTEQLDLDAIREVLADRPALGRSAALDLIHEVERLRAAAVKPDLEAVAWALCDAQTSQEHMEQTDDAPCSRCLAWADAVLALWPGRSEAEVKAEALNEAAGWLADMDDGRDTGQHRAGRDIIARLRDRADRLAAEGGAS